jgi:methanogen homocitrate synthase
VLQRSIEAIQFAKKHGLYVVFFPYDTTRADLATVRELVGGVVEHADPDAVAVVDTLGSALPDSVRYLVGEVKESAGGRPVEIHCHNDFGLGVANSLAAVAAGAQVVHVSVNSLGERTGNAPLEETAASLKVLYDLPVNIRLDALVPLSHLVEELSGVAIPKNKPVAGEITFSRETGAGIDMLIKHPTVVLPIHPRVYGREAVMRIGKKSGRLSLRLKLDSWGVEATESQLQEMLDLVKRRAIAKRSYLSDEEFREIVADVLNDGGCS